MSGVIMIVPAISNEASGPSYSVRRLCEAVRGAGVNALLAALDWSPMNEVPGYVRLFPIGAGPRRLGRSPVLARWLREKAGCGRIGVLHNNGLWMMPNVYPGWIARRYRIPYVVSPRGTLGVWPFKNGSPIKRLFWPIVQRPSLDSVTCWHATSRQEYEDIRRMGFGQPVAVIPNGIDLPGYFPKESGRLRTLLYLGRIHPKKGLDWLLNAWASLESRFPDWQLRIVGPDEMGYMRKLVSLARDLGISRVTFTGPLYGEAKWRAYAQSELFVLPTRHENFGVVVAEALASGTAAIVSRNAPWSGIEKHGCGWWIEPGVEPLVECLKHALACPQERLTEMGHKGREWVSTEFSWSCIGIRMAKVYRWLMNDGPKPEDILLD